MYKMIRKARNFGHLFLVFLVFLNILAWIVVWDLNKPRLLEVNFFDVGQGDAIFIITPQKHQILIDGGPDSVILEKLAAEMPFYDRSLDLIILTHPERDHMFGLIEILKRYKVDYILWTGVVRNTFEYKEWIKLIAEEEANVFIAREGKRVKAGRVVLDVLHPFENLAGREFKNSNDTSLVSRLVFGQNSFLFTGDITKSVEKELAIRLNSLSNSQKLATLDSDVLKVAHHGSKTSSSEEFLEKVSPKIAVIQIGKNNRYAHPHQEILNNLKKFGIKALRTDQNGDIRILSNGNSIWFIQKRKKL